MISGDNVEIFGFRHSARPVPDLTIEEELNHMEERLDTFCQRGSGWQLKNVKQLFWCQTAYNTIPQHIGHHRDFNLPPALLAKKAVVNVNDAPEGECFK